MAKVLPPASRLMTSPETVTPGAAALSVVPATTIKEKWALMSKPSIVILDGGWDAMDS